MFFRFSEESLRWTLHISLAMRGQSCAHKTNLEKIIGFKIFVLIEVWRVQQLMIRAT